MFEFETFIDSLGVYWRLAPIDTIAFWSFPIGTILFIWIVTTIGVKIFPRKRTKLTKTAVIIRWWIISSNIAALILISLICFWWCRNHFAQEPLQLSLLISLVLAMLFSVVSLFQLRSFYSQEGIKELTDQPKTMNQLGYTIVFLKQVFTKTKAIFLVPILGFLFLTFFFYKGTNLIAVVYDNSTSMTELSAVNALSETFQNLEENNEIILTTLGESGSNVPENTKEALADIMSVKQSDNLKRGIVRAYDNPQQAIEGLSQIANDCPDSPISEAIWKTNLYVQETKGDDIYANRLLIVISDGGDNISASLDASGFYYDDDKFSATFPEDKVFVIDYSGGNSNPLFNKFENAGCDIYPADNSKQDYLYALDNALGSFKNNWYLIYWTAFVTLIFSLIVIIVQPKKIV